MGSGIIREERIGDCRLILGNCLDVVRQLDPVDHAIYDPPYEQSLHDSKNSALRRIRTDGRDELKSLNFAGIDNIRCEVVETSAEVCKGWFIAFCTIEGASKWADEINPSPMKYKRACIWIKPDSTPQLNGQGPAHGAECFVTAWCGKGHARWNAGGKRGVYTHTVNPPDRHGAHPTEKPWRLFVDIIQDFTNPGETILDAFMGSGTTLVACAKLGRKGIGIELDPEYFEVACRRVEDEYLNPSFISSDPSKFTFETNGFDIDQEVG